MPNPIVSTGVKMATDGSQPGLIPVTSPTTTLFLTTLPASKAAGVAAIRMSRVNGVNGDIQLEELGAQGETIIGFVLHALVDSSTKKVTGIAVTQMGSSGTPSPFTPAQRSAFGLITNELKQFSTSSAVNAPAGTPAPRDRELFSMSDLKGILEAAAVAIDCGLAITEGGLNPLADAGCIAGATAANMGLYTDDTSEPDYPTPTLDTPVTEQAGTSYQTFSHDDPPPPPPSGGDDDGGDDGGGGDSGEGIDDKPGLQPE